MKYLTIVGTLKFKPDDPLLPLAKYTFQRTAPGKGNISNRGVFDLQMRRHVIPIDHKTQPQLAKRFAMKSAVSAWHTATQKERNAHKNNANKRKITIFNAFISAYLLNYQPPPGTVFDGGWTTWDGGTTVFDA